MLFGRKNKDEPPADSPGGDPVPDGLLERILLVVDGSEPSVVAARFAVQLGAQLGTRITAAYVVDTATMDYLLQTRIFVSEEREEFEKDLERTGQRYLDYVTTIARNHGLSIETSLIKGSIHKTILDMARNLQVDAVVVGGWRRSITRKDATSVERQLILDDADCPVIVVKAPRTS